MGMYSSFSHEDIKVTDARGLLAFITFSGLDLNDMVYHRKDDNTEVLFVTFESWEYCKLQGYWYEETIKILSGLAPYIEGEAEFIYEDQTPFRIVFRDGKAFVKFATIIWKAEDELAVEDIR